MSEWGVRAAGKVRRPVQPMQVAIFAFRSMSTNPDPEISISEAEPAEPVVPTRHCDCCCADDIDGDWEYQTQEQTLEALYEEMDWADLNLQEVPHETHEKLKKTSSKNRKKTYPKDH